MGGIAKTFFRPMDEWVGTGNKCTVT